MHFADAVSNDMKAQPDVKAYFERFYTISDTPEAHEDYAHSFTDGATLIMASKVAKGQNGRTRLPGYILPPQLISTRNIRPPKRHVDTGNLETPFDCEDLRLGQRRGNALRQCEVHSQERQ